MKTWFKENLNSFLLSLLVPIIFILLVVFLAKWVIIVSSIVIYLGILGYKIVKNKPF